MPKWCKTDKNEALSDSINSYGICHSGCDAVTGNNETLHELLFQCDRNLIGIPKDFNV